MSNNNNNFSTLKLPKTMLDNLRELDYKTMTPIQADSLPHILNNKDVIAQAKTGSGKTAAFGIGLLTKLQVKKFRVQSLILCPTRELADQVAKELRRLARFTHNIKILTLCGGMPFGPQLGSLKHLAHIIVGTPGRILQHLHRGSLILESADTLVLDEADRMLGMGFIKDISKIISFVPKNRQTLLFSATYSKEILDLSSTIQENAINIETIATESTNKISEYFYKTPLESKLSSLIRIITNFKPENALIFCNTKLESKKVAVELSNQGIETLAIHGDLEQHERNSVLVRFSNRSCAVLVATDVAARGLDIKELAMVVNYNIPNDQAIYTHRIGRTGRAGEEGIAITLYTDKQTRIIEQYKSGNDTRKFENIEDSAIDEKETEKEFSLEARNVTIVIDGGKKDKVRPGDILGALTGDAGFEKKDIGKIDIFDRKSFVAIRKNLVDKVLEKLEKGRIKGRRFSVWILR